MELDKAIQERKSVKHYSNKKPDWRDIILAIDAARYAPMAGNNFTLKFILVDDPKKIVELSKAAQQQFVAEAHYVVVAVSDPTRTINAYEKRGEIYARQQAGAAIQNFLLKIHELGLASCWVGHFFDDDVKRTLDIPGKANIEAILPVGYEPKTKYAKRLKIDMDRVLRFNDYRNKYMGSENAVSA